MRVENWPVLLGEYIENSRHLKFEWGKNDCALWVGRFLADIGVCEFQTSAEGQYDTEFGSKKFIKKMGYDSLEDLVDSQITRLSSVLMCRRGDVVMFTGALGLVTGREAYFLTEVDGLINVPLNMCEVAWRAE